MTAVWIRLAIALFCVGTGASDLPTYETIPHVPQPGYLESYIDPPFGTRITRITGAPGTYIPNVEGKWAPIARHHYSKDAAWNCDQSLLYLARHQGRPNHLFLDGDTYQVRFARPRAPGSERRWHPKEPAVMVYVQDNQIGRWNVWEDTIQTLAALEGYSEFRIGPGEGNLSRDGRMIVVDGKREDDRIAFAYDLERRQKYPDLVLNEVRIDWVSISASGKYIVLNGRIDSERGDQTQVYDLQGRKVGGLWSEYGRPSHYDLTIDDDGVDVAVGVSKSKPDSGRVIKRRLSNGHVTVLTPRGYASHTSTRNLRRPGWAYVTYQHPGPTWPPFWDEVIAVKLDGSLTVERIAHLHTNKIDYLTEAHAVPSPDGRRVLWASDWESSTGRPIGTYVAQLTPSEKSTRARSDDARKPPSYTYGAKFEPPDGRVVHAMGQWEQYNTKLLPLLPVELRPAAKLIFIEIGDTPRGWRPEGIRAMMRRYDEEGFIPSLDIAPRGNQPGQAVLATRADPRFGIDHEVASTSRFDGRIQDLARIVKEFGKPVIVRIGGEFNGWWNGYHPYAYPKAFRKIVALFRAAQADNAAFVWCYEPAAAGDFDERNNAGEYKWFPGDDVIDWFSIDDDVG